MEIYNYFIIASIVVFILTILICLIKNKKIFKTLISSAIWGVSSLLIISFTGQFTGFMLNITPYTLSSSAIFGIPGVMCIAVTKMIWKI